MRRITTHNPVESLSGHPRAQGPLIRSVRARAVTRSFSAHTSALRSNKV
jgi:hypothetical protein